MKVIVTSFCSNTLVPRSPDRWHGPVKACRQLSATSGQSRAVPRQSTSLLHFIHHWNYITNMFHFSGGTGEYAIMAYLHHVPFQSNTTECLKSRVVCGLYSLKNKREDHINTTLCLWGYHEHTFACVNSLIAGQICTIACESQVM